MCCPGEITDSYWIFFQGMEYKNSWWGEGRRENIFHTCTDACGRHTDREPELRRSGMLGGERS